MRAQIADRESELIQMQQALSVFEQLQADKEELEKLRNENVSHIERERERLCRSYQVQKQAQAAPGIFDDFDNRFGRFVFDPLNQELKQI
jgi:flagellar motility protein MotE (MotC chaperone)